MLSNVRLLPKNFEKIIENQNNRINEFIKINKRRSMLKSIESFKKNENKLNFLNENLIGFQNFSEEEMISLTSHYFEEKNQKYVKKFIQFIRDDLFIITFLTKEIYSKVMKSIFLENPEFSGL